KNSTLSVQLGQGSSPLEHSYISVDSRPNDSFVVTVNGQHSYFNNDPGETPMTTLTVSTPVNSQNQVSVLGVPANCPLTINAFGKDNVSLGYGSEGANGFRSSVFVNSRKENSADTTTLRVQDEGGSTTGAVNLFSSAIENVGAQNIYYQGPSTSVVLDE